MSQSIHNDGNWQRVDTGEWVPKAEHDNLRFALTDALVREDALEAENARLKNERVQMFEALRSYEDGQLRVERERDALKAQVERLTAALQEVVEICDEGDTGADFKRVVSAMQHASEALSARATKEQK